MQSPSFDSRRTALAEIFRRNSLRRTWRYKVRYALRDRVLPDPVDYMDFHVTLSRNVGNLIELVTRGEYQPRTPARLLMEKSRGLCRQIVLPSAQDALVLQRLSDNFFSSIRGKSPSSEAYFEPDNFTFDETGKRSRGYGSLAAWLHFQNKLNSICTTNNYIVVTDIANYYDHIGFSALRNIISSTVSTPEAVLDLLLRILSAMNWAPDYLPMPDGGLPQIDLDAPRILAHSFLFDLDRYAEKNASGRFTRYMDDINFGVESIAAAKRTIRDVDLLLHARQVRLNSGKTAILSAKEARGYFRFADHSMLDAHQMILEITPQGSAPYSTAADTLQKQLKSGYWKGQFDHGHGDKVLKRLLSLCRISGRSVPDRILADILRRRPTCRDAVLGYLSSRPVRAKSIALIADFVTSPETIDDVGPLTGSHTLIGMQIKSRKILGTYAKDICSILETGGPHRLYAAIWLMSKYGTDDDIMNLLLKYANRWSASHELGRLVGGLYPRLYRTRSFARYKTLIQSSASQSAGSTFQFHARIAHDADSVNAIHAFLVRQNPSRANGITHQKFLMILSALKNSKLTDKYKDNIMNAHVASLRDIYYRDQVSAAVGGLTL